ncbi:hypothetical protein QYE76_054826 [Lolium multiflorum]|uniref:Uncharacterized protein n=1 Tax=Lolium multiflorum TaxID=4521 RepID=A0AAD8WL84_LOLMU|nr:hypothetical protein QYE76_054826 [Lolium multiflorum]
MAVFFRVKKETKDKAMLNREHDIHARPGRMYPPHDRTNPSGRNAGWFYEKNAPVPEIHDGLPKFNNEPPEELASWSFIPPPLTPISGEGSARISLLATLAEENLRTILRVPVSGDTAEEVPEDEEEEASTPTATRTASQEPITKFLKKSPAVGPPTPAPPSASHTAPPSSPPQADQSPPPAANTPPEIIPVSSEKVGGEDPKAKGPAQEEAQDQGEAEDFKKGVGEFLDKLICKQKEQQALHYELHKNIALQRRVTLGQAENIQTLKEKNAELNKQLAGPRRIFLPGYDLQLENLRSSYQELELKLKERSAEGACPGGEKLRAYREKGEFLLKRNADSETIKRQQKELNGLRKYMETASTIGTCWPKIFWPLGYPEKRRNKFPRDDVLSLAGDDCKDLISASRKICHNLSLKRSRTCSLRKLIKRMDILPELVTDLQASSARGAAAMTLTMCLAHHPKMDLDRVSSGVPPTADVGKLLDAVSGYDTRIARKIRHEEFYDKVVLPADEPLEDELQKERDAEARPAESGSQYTWTSSKDAPEEEEPKTSAATSDEDEESDEDVSSPAEGAKGKDPEAMLLRPRRSENVYVLRDKTMHHFGPTSL